MKRLLLIFATSVASLVACNDNRPAADPSSAMTTSPAPVTTSATQVTNVAPTDSAPAVANPSSTGGTPVAPHAASLAPTTSPMPANPPSAAAQTTSAPTNPNADNSGNNATPAGARGLTAADQGGSATDRKITQQIRQAVMGDSSLSFMAKNVKIITINGKVTLKGPVKSDQERSAIEVAAKRIAGDAQVDNQIEIKK